MNDQNKKYDRKREGRRREGYKRGDRNFNKEGNVKDKEGNFGKDRGIEIRNQNNPINDPKFYYINDRIGKATGSIPYNIFPGTLIDLKTKVGISNDSNKAVPGVAVLEYISQPGKSTDSSSAVNIAARAIYSWVRHQNSGHSNYESSDLMLYILAMDEIYTRYFECKRAYEVAMTYDMVNRNIPDLLQVAMNIDGISIRNNLAQYRAGLNILAAKISSLAVPEKFHLFKRHAVISSAIFMDSTSKRGQYYLWNQKWTHKYNPQHVGGGALEAKALGTNRTWVTLLQELEDLLGVVLTDDDMNIMSGDILKAYGRENLYTLPFVDEAATVNFVYDENMLAQIENATSEGVDIANISTADITQSNNVLISNPTFDASVMDAHIFNSHKDEPDWEDTLEWSRGITFNGEFGSEVVTDFKYVVRAYDANDQEVVKVYIKSSYVDVAQSDFLESLCTMSCFDWHPIMYIVGTTGGTIDSYKGFIGDVKKFTVLNQDTVKRLHDCAVMGELNALLLEQNTTM